MAAAMDAPPVSGEAPGPGGRRELVRPATGERQERVLVQERVLPSGLLPPQHRELLPTAQEALGRGRTPELARGMQVVGMSPHGKRDQWESKRAQWGQRKYTELQPVVTATGGKSSFAPMMQHFDGADFPGPLAEAMARKAGMQMGAGFYLNGKQQLSGMDGQLGAPIVPPRSRSPAGWAAQPVPALELAGDKLVTAPPPGRQLALAQPIQPIHASEGMLQHVAEKLRSQSPTGNSMHQVSAISASVPDLSAVKSSGSSQTPTSRLRLKLGIAQSAGNLCPSVAPSLAPTPRDQRQAVYPGMLPSRLNPVGIPVMNIASIQLPAASAANDASRVKNSGKALFGGGFPGGGKNRMTKVASEPTLVGPQAVSMASTPLEAKTPRRQRGMVSKVSHVPVGVPIPLSPQRSASPSKARRQRETSPERGRGTPRPMSPTQRPTSSPPSPGSTMRSVTKRKVTFAIEDYKDEPIPEVRSSKSLEDGTPSPALRKSLKLLDGLFELRRVVKEPEGEVGEDGVAAAMMSDEAHDDLLHNTLAELNDTEAVLRGLEAQLAVGQEFVGEVGGARHATSVVSLRALLVVRRKADLLRDVEARIAAFDEAQSVAESEILPTLLANSAPAPKELAGIRRFISQYTHSPGNPAEANKSVFQHFVSTFKLPAKHAALVHLRDLASMAGEWWAETCLSEASKGMEHAALRRLFDVALGTGVPKDHPKLIRATIIINDRLALRCLKEATERNDRDEFAAAKLEPGKALPVGPAGKAADEIDKQVNHAVKEGVPASDERLKEAALIAKRLREKDNERKRLAAREKRLAEAAAKKKAEEREAASKA